MWGLRILGQLKHKTEKGFFQMTKLQTSKLKMLSFEIYGVFPIKLVAKVHNFCKVWIGQYFYYCLRMFGEVTKDKSQRNKNS